MKKNYLVKVFSLSIASIILLSGISHANDNTTQLYETSQRADILSARGISNPIEKTVNGKTYSFYTGSYKNEFGAMGSTHVKSLSGAVPKSWMGAHVNLYNYNTGNLAVGGSWRYNSITTSSLASSTGNISTLGTYITKGTVEFYNGNGYTGFTANKSPVVVNKELNTNLPEIVLNERQYLYETKQLMSAEGVDGTQGYVKEFDLYNEKNKPTNLEEANTYMEELENNEYEFYMIPLYDKDGFTIVGEFPIYCGDDIYSFLHNYNK